ncbi:MAG: tRNA (N(6)-L-threonylcarbamoyladenosine(37)-C(2))-methylthiotransferase [Thermoproteota archaeon]
MSHKVYLLNYGCAVNRAEGEVMAGVLISRGFTIVDDENEADLVLVNTCGVKTPTENKIIHRLKTISRNKKIIVSGCLPKIIGVERILEARNVEGILGPAAGKEVLKAVQKVLEGSNYIGLDGGAFNNLLPCLRENPVIGKVVISQGCLGACSYCATRFARGRLKSYGIEEIISAILKHVEDGAKEIWLSSQDNSVYGLDMGESIVSLLEKVANMEGNFIVRVGMMNPRRVLEHFEHMAEILKGDRFFKFIHIPLQSGSNKVLKDMNRDYYVEDFVRLVSKFRGEIPKISVETDIIVGYPTETEVDFEKTLETIREIKPDFLNISKFYARPGTPASRLPRLPTEVVTKRSRILSKLASEIREEKNSHWVGWEGFTLVDEIGTIPGSFISRNIYYKPIVLKQPVKLGSFVRVYIVAHKPNFLIGKGMESLEAREPLKVQGHPDPD